MYKQKLGLFMNHTLLTALGAIAFVLLSYIHIRVSIVFLALYASIVFGLLEDKKLGISS